MPEDDDWSTLRARRMAEPSATETYLITKLAFELGRAIRSLRQEHGWSQAELARAAKMTQSAVARFEAGGTVPTLVVLDRLARALDADLTVKVSARKDVA